MTLRPGKCEMAFQAKRFGRWAIPVAILVTTTLMGACDELLPTEASPSGSGDSDVLSGSAESPTDATPLSPTDVDTLHDSSVSGLTSERRQVVRMSEDWIDVWGEITAPWISEDPAPEVDFSSRQIIVVASGDRPTGGYDVDVRSIGRVNDTLYVVVDEVAPAPDCVTSEARTQPVLVLRVPLQSGPVEFVEEESVQSCS